MHGNALVSHVRGTPKMSQSVSLINGITQIQTFPCDRLVLEIVWNRFPVMWPMWQGPHLHSFLTTVVGHWRWYRILNCICKSVCLSTDVVMSQYYSLCFFPIFCWAVERNGNCDVVLSCKEKIVNSETRSKHLTFMSEIFFIQCPLSHSTCLKFHVYSI